MKVIICAGALFCALATFPETGTANVKYNPWPFAMDIGRYRIEAMNRKYEPSDMALKDSTTGETLAVLRQALKGKWLYQLRNRRYLYYLGSPPGASPLQNRALLMFDLETLYTHIIYKSPTLINFEVSKNEKMAAVVHNNGSLEVLNLLTKERDMIIENDAYRRNTGFRWPKACWKSTFIQFMGWSQNALNLWFMLKTPDSGVIFARVSDGLLEEFDYFDTVTCKSCFYDWGHSPYALKGDFNIERGWVLHVTSKIDEIGKKAGYLALTDLNAQKNVPLGIRCSGYKWKNKNEISCRGREAPLRAAQYLCIQE